jgi:hypothetical protein
MKTFKACVLLLGVSLIASAADYKPGWNAEQFYEEMSACRTAIVAPAINAYLQMGAAAKKTADELRNESISMLPLFEHAASAGCFCALNGLAKSKDYQSYFGTGDFTARMTLVKGQLDLPSCAASMTAAVDGLGKDQAEAMRLK